MVDYLGERKVAMLSFNCKIDKRDGYDCYVYMNEKRLTMDNDGSIIELKKKEKFSDKFKKKEDFLITWFYVKSECFASFNWQTVKAKLVNDSDTNVVVSVTARGIAKIKFFGYEIVEMMKKQEMMTIDSRQMMEFFRDSIKFAQVKINEMFDATIQNLDSKQVRDTRKISSTINELMRQNTQENDIRVSEVMVEDIDVADKGIIDIKNTKNMKEYINK